MSGRLPRLAVPAGAVDSAIHIYHASVPAARGGPPVPGDFPESAYQAVQRRLGLKRVVVVQPNAYQDDNRVMLEAIRALGPGAKGVGVVKPGVTDAEIERLTKGGIVAQRIFQMQWGAVGLDRVHEVMARVQAFGWFATIQLDGRELPQWEQTIRKLPGRFVIDHIGKFLEPVPPGHEAFKALLRLVDTGRCWVRLAGAYETSKTGAPAYEDVSRLARALVKHAPERMIWASNWPHPSAPKDKVPDDADLLDLLLDWAPDEAVRRKILVDNPAGLYGF